MRVWNTVKIRVVFKVKVRVNIKFVEMLLSLSKCSLFHLITGQMSPGQLSTGQLSYTLCHHTLFTSFCVTAGGGIAINCMCVNEAFCVTGSEDGFLRLWPLDFKHVYLEAGKHEGTVIFLRSFVRDHLKIFQKTLVNVFLQKNACKIMMTVTKIV